MNKIIKFLALGGVVWLCAQYLDGIIVVDYTHAIIAAVVLAIVNTLIRPILDIISLPFTLVTFGLFSLVLTAFMVEIMDYFVSGITVTTFWRALLFGVIVSGANSFIDRLQNPKKKPMVKKETFTAYEEVD
ncbi:MAG: phage holin family protein [Bacteroidetes bacterium]|jgi:putative membrane protein|nr:phage holin family protein [Bacteroidota bacterium]